MSSALAKLSAACIMALAGRYGRIYDIIVLEEYLVSTPDTFSVFKAYRVVSVVL